VVGEQAEGQVDDGGGAAMTACSLPSLSLSLHWTTSSDIIDATAVCCFHLDMLQPTAHRHAACFMLMTPARHNSNDRIASRPGIPTSPPLLPTALHHRHHTTLQSLLHSSLHPPHRSWCEARPFRHCDILACSSDHLAQASSPSLMHFDPIFTRRPWWPCPVA
jgi:hypothetical protein